MSSTAAITGHPASDFYAENGYLIVRDAIAKSELGRVRATVAALVRERARKAGGEVAERIGAMAEEDLPHAGLIGLRDAGAELMRQVVDSFRVTASVQCLLHRMELSALAAPLVGAAAPEYVALAHTNIRVDLPAHFQTEQARFSLPWHQESGYYTAQVVRDRGVVIWIPLFDCMAEDGCLEVCIGSHRHGQVPHEGYYLDPENKRNYRVRVSDDVVTRHSRGFAEVEAGSVLMNHFNLIHRSGMNRSDRVRYTLLVRASNVLDPGFIA